MKLEYWHTAEDKRRFKIVWTYDYSDILGEIETADEKTGECHIRVGGKTKEMYFGPGGIKILLRDK